MRRSRSRFWAPASGAQQDKHDAYFTLYEALVAVAKLIAPFTPFLAEELYQNLVRRPWPTTQPESVHLCAYPEPDASAVDEPLAVAMRAVRELVSLGLQVRTANKLKVRQPLGRADVVLSQASLKGALADYEALVREELNVHEVHWLLPGEERGEVRYVLKPNFRALGPKLGKKVQIAKQVLAGADAAALRASLATDGKVTILLDGEAVELGPEEIEVVVEAAEGFAAAGGRAGVVVLHTALTDALRDEGLGGRSSRACRACARSSTSASPSACGSPSTGASGCGAWWRRCARRSPRRRSRSRWWWERPPSRGSGGRPWWMGKKW